MKNNEGSGNSLNAQTIKHIKKLSRELELSSGIKRKAGPMQDKKKNQLKYEARDKVIIKNEDEN